MFLLATDSHQRKSNLQKRLISYSLSIKTLPFLTILSLGLLIPILRDPYENTILKLNKIIFILKLTFFLNIYMKVYIKTFLIYLNLIKYYI